MLEIACTLCGKRYKVKDEVLGRQVRCAGCKTEFVAQAAPSLMELALLSPGSKLAEVVRSGSIFELGFFLNHHFTMVQVDDCGGLQPLMAELVIDGKRYSAVVVFTNTQAASVFAGNHREHLDETGEMKGFVMQGSELIKHTPKKISLWFNAESDDSALLQPADWEPLRQAQQRFKKEPQLKNSIPQPNPLAGQQSTLADAATNVRNQTLAYLDYMGFQCARWLPVPDMSRRLRPTIEIAGRLAALAGVFAWASAPKEVMPNSFIADYFKKNSLGKYLTKEEAAIVSQSRTLAAEKHQHQIGWRLENMWPLAWVLGFENEPDIDGAQMAPDTTTGLMFEFLEKLDIGMEALLQKCQPRSVHEVIAKEDLFYCAHNAVRSAQGGHATVPAGFDPVGNGGVIHERRHALTWCLSPGVRWQDTDLST